MMVGRVLTTREPILSIVIHGPSGASVNVQALVDSGFTGLLPLPRMHIERLALTFRGHAAGTLADGTRVITRRFAAWVDWHGQRRKVFALESGAGPMIGMSLLYGSRVAFDARDDGRLTIEPLE